MFPETSEIALKFYSRNWKLNENVGQSLENFGEILEKW